MTTLLEQSFDRLSDAAVRSLVKAAGKNSDQVRREHFDAEGRSPVNENPDGCYYCGSSQHHSGDCQDRE